MIAYILIVFGFMMRLLPHAPNMVPVAAIALFAGVYLNKKITPWVPLLIMAASDLIIGLHDMIFYTWGSFILIGYIGVWLRGRRSWKNIFLTSVFSSLLFFGQKQCASVAIRKDKIPISFKNSFLSIYRFISTNVC